MSTMILSPTRVQRTLEVATAALLTLAVMACKSQSTSVNGAPSAQPLLALTLPGEIDLPNGAVLQGDDIWVAGYPKLFVGSKSKPAVAVDVKLDDKAVGVWSVRPGKAGELALVVGELHGKSRIVRFDTDKRTATVVTTAKDPRQIAWVGPANSWWYTATDTSLNTLPDGKAEAALRPGKYNTLVLSADGRQAAVREIDSRDILLCKDTAAPTWTVFKKGFQGQLAGFDNKGRLLLVHMKVTAKGDSTPSSRIVAVDASGAEHAVLSDVLTVAVARHDKLFIAKGQGRKYTIELRPIP